MRTTLHRFDKHWTQWVASVFGQTSHRLFEHVTALGDPLFVGLIACSLFGIGVATSNTQLAISAAVIPATIVLGAVLKILFERARPVTEYAMNMKLQTFSFPSGHSSGSMIAYGLLTYIAVVSFSSPWSYIVAIACALVPLFVGISRIYLGAHFPSDVIAGWLLGAAALLIVIYMVAPSL